MFLIAFSVLVLCIWPCFLCLLWPSLEPGQGSFSDYLVAAVNPFFSTIPVKRKKQMKAV